MADNQYLSLCLQGRTVDAVRLYRARTGCRLGEAKLEIERIIKEHFAAAAGERR